MRPMGFKKFAKEKEALEKSPSKKDRQFKRGEKQITTKEVMEAWIAFENPIPFKYYIEHRKAVKRKNND